MEKLFTIVVGSHYFKIKDPTPLAVELIKRYSFGNIEFMLEKDEVTGQMRRVPKNMYASRKLDNSEFRFSIAQYDHFIWFLKEKNFKEGNYTVVKRDMYKPAKASSKMKMPKTWVPRERQVPIIDYMIDDGYTKIITLQTGQGKCQPLDADIRVPGGWMKMGQMQVGTPVIAADGTVTRVQGVYPQGPTQVYRVTFGDGRHVEVGGEHLWKVFYNHSEAVITTLQLLTLIDQRIEVSIPLVTPDAGRNTLPCLPMQLPQSQDTALDPDYLEGGHAFRHLLLNHLLDKHDVYQTNCYKLAKDVVYLIRSLGGMADEVSEMVKSDYRYHVSFQLPREDLTLPVVDITPTRVVDTQCISIKHPSSLYVTNDFIVTHNTASSLKAIEKIGHRLLIVVLGRFFDKWIEDVGENYGFEEGDRLITLRGFKALQGFMMELESEEEIDFDVMIMTTTTYSDYIKHYCSQDGQVEMPSWWIRPEDFCERLGIGVKLTDEIHMHFHANFVCDLHTHVPKTIGLSATLESDQEFESKMYEVAYPAKYRKDGGTYIKYINVKSVHYQIGDIKRVRHKQRGAYSHNLFERSLFKQKQSFKRYLQMIYTLVDTEYLQVRKDYKQKMLIFASNVFVCEAIRDYLRQRIEDKQLVINKYTSEDDLEVITEQSHICVTTIGSAGTGLDVKGLITCLMTTAIATSKANLQVLGRLRELHDYPDQDPTFLYLVCDTIPKHRDYHKRKRKLFRDKTLTQNETHYSGFI